ncbi:unnamed protein product, partial [Rotaria sordida]
MWLSSIYLIFLLDSILSAKYNRICYFTNWGAHRSLKESRLYPEDIPPDLCTHILYAFANLHGRSLQPQLTSAQVAATIHNYECSKKIIILSR